MEQNDKVYIVQLIQSIVLQAQTGVQIFSGRVKGYTDKEVAVYIKDSNGEEVVMIIPNNTVFSSMSDALTAAGEQLQSLTN